jgi:hypothetical protein
VPHRERRKLLAPGDEEYIGSDDERARSHVRNIRKGRVQVAVVPSRESLRLKPDAVGGHLQVPRYRVDIGIGGVNQQDNSTRGRNQFVQATAAASAPARYSN